MGAIVESRKNVFLAAALFLALAGPLNWWAARGLAPAPESLASEDDAISDTVRAILGGSGPPLHRPGDLVGVQASLAALYQDAPGLRWTAGGAPGPLARAAVAILQDAESDGLVPDDYDAAWLRERLGALTARATATPVELAVFEATLSTELLRFMSDLHRGRVSPARAGFAYHIDLQGDDLGRRLRRATDEADLPGMVAELRPAFPQYARLRRALASYRAEDCEGTEAAPQVRQIELALERLRWLPHPIRGPFLVANVPAFRLVAFRSMQDEAPELQMPIVVGRAARTETPLFVDELTTVIFRPYWYPPPSIIRNEIVPALARNPGYLARENMDLVAATDDTSPALAARADTLSELRSGRLALRQRPGPHNALGLVKFVFPNDYRVYMHDTPARALFERPRRDFSHGCIRVARPAELARFVLSGQPAWGAEKIAAAMAGSRTIRASVDPPIPVFIFYTTAIVRADQTVEFFEDVYGLDARLECELAAPR